MSARSARLALLNAPCVPLVRQMKTATQRLLATCVAGSITAAGATSCTPCAAGLADLDANPATACDACPGAGYYSAPGSAACTMCEANWKDHDLTRRHLVCLVVRVLFRSWLNRVQPTDECLASRA